MVHDAANLDTLPSEQGRQHCNTLLSVRGPQRESHVPGLGDTLTQPTDKDRAFPATPSMKQMNNCSVRLMGGHAINIACQRVNWAKQIQFCLLVPSM